MIPAAAIPIYEGQDFYVPYFEVKIGDKKADREVVRDIRQVTYKDNIKEIDSFEIVINNWDSDARDFKYSDETLFDPGKKIELWMGYYGGDNLRPMISGEITSLRPNFPASGGPTLSISGLNLLHRLRVKQRSAAYTGLKDSEIAQRIAARLSIDLRIDSAAKADEKTYNYLFQDNQYDIIFLMERARRIGYDLFVEEDKKDKSRLYFGPSVNLRRTTYRLSYNRSVVNFQPNLTTANQVGKVTVRAWDFRKKEKIEVTATREHLSTKGVGKEGGQAAIDKSFADREEVITDRPVEDKNEAKTLAIETLESIAKDMIKGSGSTVGLPDLRAGSLIHFDGLGKRFSGRYFVTATTHSIGDSGYTTQFDCRREEL